MVSILLVSQDKSLAEHLITFLQRRGYATQVADRGDADTLGRPPPALIIIEGRTLNEGAWELVREAAASKVPVLILANTSQIGAGMAREGGADVLLRMPFTAEELERTIEDLLRAASGPGHLEGELTPAGGEGPRG